MRQRLITLAGTGLAGAALSAAWAAPAAADERGFSVRVTAPEQFTAGSVTQTITAVVTSQNRQCRKVRWVLVVRTGVEREQLRFTRIEDEQAFEVSTETRGDTTTIIDTALDPGTLCRGRTVTGTWQVAFTGPDGGDVRFEARAFDAADTLLTTAGATAGIEGEEEEEPSPSPSPSDTSTPEEDVQTVAPDETVEPTGAPAADGTDAGGAVLASEDSSLLGPGLIVGGVFVSLGLLLLVRLRSRAQEARRKAEAVPTGFYTVPRSR